eukprot:scaffold26082_cov36-Cyclotella_meneghiniana.AAC.1
MQRPAARKPVLLGQVFIYWFPPTVNVAYCESISQVQGPTVVQTPSRAKVFESHESVGPPGANVCLRYLVAFISARSKIGSKSSFLWPRAMRR